MKTEYKMIIDTIEWGKNNSMVPQIEIQKEEEKLKICNECPIKKTECFSCGVHRWWIYTGSQPQPEPR